MDSVSSRQTNTAQPIQYSGPQSAPKESQNIPQNDPQSFPKFFCIFENENQSEIALLHYCIDGGYL